jgi:branched-chain amino acid transport system ATP-binding protein
MAKTELAIHNLFVARGGRPVLRDVSINVPRGEITALLGANGAGKSTLVLTVAGVLPALRGNVSCDGVQL